MDVPEIDVEGLARLHAEGAPVLDVREADEYAAGHVPGAQHIPLTDVPDRLGDLPTERPLYVICKTGGRSFKATEFLLARGVEAANVSGGTMAWIEAGQPVVGGSEPR
ncbi:rhodanese-like domain-containing protein [soil metagenome]